MKGRSEQQIHILEGTIRVFNKKGMKFTMDDLAKELGMSKKTIYVSYKDKQGLFFDMVDYLFDNISEKKREVVTDGDLTTVEKIRRILGVMPESYSEIDFRQLYMLKDKYPVLYSQVEKRLETGWEETIALIEQGKKEGVIRDVPIFLVKTMLEASLEQFFARDILVTNKISYNDALEAVVDILVDGIAVKQPQKAVTKKK
ncbi:MAG: TetR/AcrR family transcriptional regulator [Lachnospiraceae bacterium]|nr:TetR/AcrR family transcriptional regulator [Lachnospiraceae bacterium]